MASSLGLALSGTSQGAFAAAAGIQQQRDPLSFLDAAKTAFKEGREEEGQRLIGELRQVAPQHVNTIFRLVWELSGKPNPESDPARAHPHFGEVAFFGREGRSCASEIKMRALEETERLVRFPKPDQYCPFCDPKVVQAQLLYTDGKLWNVYNSINSDRKGHLLLVPIHHVARSDQMSPEQGAALVEVVKKCSEVFKKLYDLPQNDYILIQKNGTSAGQSVHHVHYHMVPVPPDSLQGVLGQVFAKDKRPIDDEMRREIVRIKDAFQGLDRKDTARPDAALISAQMEFCRHLITKDPSLVNLGVKWRLEALAEMAEGSQKVELEKLIAQVPTAPFRGAANFYAQLADLDSTFKPSSLPFAQGRDRHQTVTPYQFNQVHLGEQTPMNASRIKFPKHDQSYSSAPTYCFAMSAPMPEYFSRTFHMVADEKIGVVVNLTEFEEGATVKAHRYLPEKGKVDHAEYSLTTIKRSEERLDDSWELEQKECEIDIDSRRHTLAQFHVRGWKDFTPGNTKAIAKVIAKVVDYEKGHPGIGPCAVHCSGGVGRTGVFIAGKRMLELMRKGVDMNDAEVKKIALQMRLQRHYLGGSEAQYKVLFSLRDELKAYCLKAFSA